MTAKTFHPLFLTLKSGSRYYAFARQGDMLFCIPTDMLDASKPFHDSTQIACIPKHLILSSHEAA